MRIITSKRFRINVLDGVKGLGMAAGSAVAALIGKSLEKGEFTIDWITMWHVGAAAGAYYIIHKFFTPAQIIKPAQL